MGQSAATSVTVEQPGDSPVTVVHLDDGKANALGYEAIEQLHGALDAAEGSGAVVITGRPGLFSAGFDLRVMGEGVEAATRLVGTGADLLVRIYGYPRPVVAACTGHALAGGALLLLSTDSRLGAEGAFRIGLNETAIGLTLPTFAMVLAEDRISRRHLTRATVQAAIYDPSDAVDAGYLDRVVAPEAVVDEAVAEARRLAELDAGAYRATKARLRRASIERARASIADELAGGRDLG